MDVAGASLLDQAPVNQFTINNGTNQHWRRIPVDAVKNPHPIAIVSVNSGKALEVPNNSREPGTFIQQYSLNFGANQLWLLDPSPYSQSVQIVNVNSRLALDSGASTTPGTGIQQNQPNLGLNQQWFMLPDGVPLPAAFVTVPLLRGALIPIARQTP
jgi:hypothetical protein